jgi:hypothetical protein
MKTFLRWIVAAVIVSGCTQGAGQQSLSTDPFIAVSLGGAELRTTSSAQPVNNKSNFYIGLNRTELGQRWFFTAYLKHFFPGEVSTGAGITLGTRVVSFAIQNDKLFVFDVSDGKASSVTFDPQLVIDAFPLVHAFDGQDIGDRFVIFDPATGIDQIGFLGDAFSESLAVKFTTELTYLQDFRKLADGITYERVFSGYLDQQVPTPGYGELNDYRYSGTLGTALRRYSEGAGFVPRVQFPIPWFFESDPLLISGPDGDTPRSFTWADRWNIHPGMKPLTWVISSRVSDLAKDPVYGVYDVYGAVQRGIEGWNDAFGFKVFETRPATPDDSFGDDDVNFLIWDNDDTVGFAFANWRTNPNTGETRGGSVYMNQEFLEFAHLFFPDDPGAATAKAQIASRKRAPTPTLTWAGMRPHPLCQYWALQFTDEFREQLVRQAVGSASASSTGLTKKQKVERYVQNVVTHEFGHILGLRHNFKGSLIPPASSVMDYPTPDDQVATPDPQAYDIAAVRFLYGLDPNPPSQPFCTDEDTLIDPDCNRRDTGAHPLTDYFGPNYQAFLSAFLQGLSDSPPDVSLNGVLQYVRAAIDPTVQEQAFRIAIDPIRSPLDPSKVSDPLYAPRADVAASGVLSRLYLDAPELRGVFVADPPLVDGYATDVLGELRGELLDVDGIRSYPSRRAAVDVLKKLQVIPAYTILLEAQGALEAQIPTLTGTDKALAEDLRARIVAAISPYFS